MGPCSTFEATVHHVYLYAMSRWAVTGTPNVAIVMRTLNSGQVEIKTFVTGWPANGKNPQ